MLAPLLNKSDKIMITGAQGNLGGQLMRVLGNEYRLVLLDRAELDITDQESVDRAVDFHKPHYIINVAAYNAVDTCEENNEQYQMAQKLNVIAVGNLAKAALKFGAVFIQYSTDYVFGGIRGEDLQKFKDQGGFMEDDKPKPGNKYAETKLMGEREILKLKDEGLKYYLIRTSKLFGPKGESELAKPSFFDIMLKLSETRNELEVVDEELSCFTYTIDLARATKELIEEEKEFGIYHIVNEGAVTWYEGALELFKLAGKSINVKPVSGDKFPRPAKRPEYSVLKNTKLKPLRDYKEALKEYLVK